MRPILRRHPFLLIGLLTYALFLLVDALGGSGVGETLAGPMRILIVPMYLAWLLVTITMVAIFGQSGPPSVVAPVVGAFDLVAGLAPYLLADYLLDRWRRGAIRGRDAKE